MNARPLSSPWLSMEVRPWLVLAVVLLLAAGGLSAARMQAYLHERRVIESGPVVDATVINIGQAVLAKQGTRDEELYVQLRYKSVDGKDVDVYGTLPRKAGGVLSTKDVLSIHIDPADATYWTARDEPQPLSLVLTVPLLCLPGAIVCGAVAWMRKLTMQRVAARGEAKNARVANIKVSPLAPLSKLISVTVHDDANRRVLHCYWPAAGGAVKAGDAVHVIQDGKRVLAARLV